MISLVTALVPAITNLLSEFITDKDKAGQLAHDISTLAERQAHEQITAQIAVNKQEAAHKSLFVAGWRPGTGWVCLTAMASNYIVMPYLAVFGYTVPVLDLGEMMPVLLGMLGLGGMRTYEKRNGVARER